MRAGIDPSNLIRNWTPCRVLCRVRAGAPTAGESGRLGRTHSIPRVLNPVSPVPLHLCPDSYIMWIFRAAMLNEFKDRKYNCVGVSGACVPVRRARPRPSAVLTSLPRMHDGLTSIPCLSRSPAERQRPARFSLLPHSGRVGLPAEGPPHLGGLLRVDVSGLREAQLRSETIHGHATACMRAFRAYPISA